MRPFACPNCLRLSHFEVRVCPDCAATLGYDPAIDRFRHLADEGTTWKDRNDDPADLVVCANNNDFGICNWLTTRDAPGGMCRACRHNRTIPDLADPAVPALWGKVEEAKRRLFHTLIRLGLPLETKAEETPTAQGLAFDFLYDPAAVQGGAKKIVTGHDEGLITLDVAEADDAHRERVRLDMGEPYRTLLGHFRHEVGHHFWSRLVAIDEPRLERSARCSETSARIMAKRWPPTTAAGRSPGPRTSSAPMRRATRGRILLKPLPTTFTSSTCWPRRAASTSRSQRSVAVMVTGRWPWNSIPTAPMPRRWRRKWRPSRSP
jgi:hypothetical protein